MTKENMDGLCERKGVSSEMGQLIVGNGVWDRQ